MGAGNQKPNIFDKLVTKEDDYTQLLHNLMLRSDKFRDKVLSLLFPDELADLIKPSEIKTQYPLPNKCGRPDIFIRTAELCLLIEVKTELYRGMTSNQSCLVDERKEFSGYAGYLLRVAKEIRRHLVYLVPEGWIYCDEMSGRLKGLEKQGVETKMVCWDKVREAIQDSDNPLIQEFHALLAERFQPLTL